MLPRESLTTITLLDSCRVTPLDDGNTVYTSERFLDFNPYPDRLQDEPFQLAVSLEGDKLRKKYPESLEFLDPVKLRSPERRTGRDEYSYRVHRLGNWPNQHHVAVKEIPFWQAGLNAVQHLEAIEALKKQGIAMASPLMATHWSYMCQWEKGSRPLFDIYFRGAREAVIAEVEKEFDKYISMLVWTINKLVIWGEWSKNWGIDTRKDNYLIGNRDAKDPRERFIALDPVYAD